jgi:hypothetical protein
MVFAFVERIPTDPHERSLGGFGVVVDARAVELGGRPAREHPAEEPGGDDHVGGDGGRSLFGVALEERSFVAVHRRKRRSILDEHAHDALALHQEDVAHVADQLERRPPAGRGPAPGCDRIGRCQLLTERGGHRGEAARQLGGVDGEHVMALLAAVHVQQTGTTAGVGSGDRGGRVEPRELWQRFETVHAVTYFTPECRDAHAATGLKGFWMGYFAGRAAPLGAVGPAVVGSLFFNFHEAMVRRALPDAWERATPATVIAERSAAAAAALRRLDPSIDERAARVNDSLRRAVAAAPVVGRALFAANRELRPDDEVEAMWQSCTSLREHRGDGHVAALTAAGLDGCQVHALLVAATGTPAEIHRDARGWSPVDWDEAVDGLRRRGLLEGDGALTAAGAALRDEIESVTDRLAAAPWAHIEAEDLAVVAAELDAIARAVQRAGEIRFPNPMGLPPLT